MHLCVRQSFVVVRLSSKVVFIVQLLCVLLGRLGIRLGLLGVLFSYACICDALSVTIRVKKNISCQFQFFRNSQILPNSIL
jgi:hypothetical protein